MSSLEQLISMYSRQCICEHAAEIGDLKLLQEARAEQCPWSAAVCANAALNGHLHILQWAHEHGCPWDWFTCSSAAEGGHLHVLQWAREHGCRWDEHVCECAINNNHIHILEWAILNGCPSNDTLRSAAHAGNLDLLKHLITDLQVPIFSNEELYEYAALGGHLNVLEWLNNSLMPVDPLYPDICMNAAENGHLHVLKWARERNLRWDVRTCWVASKNNHLDVLKWACENGCLCDEMCIFIAVDNYNYEIAVWLLENVFSLTKKTLSYIINDAWLDSYKNNPLYHYYISIFPHDIYHLSNYYYLRDFKNLQKLFNYGFFSNSNMQSWLSCIESNMENVLHVNDLTKFITMFI